MLESLQRALRASLTNGASPPDSHFIAVTAHSRITQLGAAVTDLIGALGFRALLSRSVHLTRRKHEWLSLSPPGDADTSAASLHELFAGQEPRLAAEAAVTLLTTMAQLLASFIGEPFTNGLLHQAWPDVYSEQRSQESQHE